MFAATLKPGERVRIGDRATIQVVAIDRRGRVRLTFDTTENVKCDRSNPEKTDEVESSTPG